MNLLENVAVVPAEADRFGDLHTRLCRELGTAMTLVTAAELTPLTLETWATTPARQQEACNYPSYASDCMERENHDNARVHRIYHQWGRLRLETWVNDTYGSAYVAKAYVASASFKALQQWLTENWQVKVYTDPGYPGDCTGVPSSFPSVNLSLQAKVLSPAAQAYQAELARRRQANLQLVHQQLPALLVRNLRPHLPSTKCGEQVVLKLRLGQPRDSDWMDDACKVEPHYLMPAYLQDPDLWPEFKAKRIPSGWHLQDATLDCYNLQLTLQRAA